MKKRVYAVCRVAFENNGKNLSCGGAPIWRTLGEQFKKHAKMRLHVFQVDGNETVVIVSNYKVRTYNDMATVLDEPLLVAFDNYKLQNLAKGSIPTSHKICRDVGADVQEFRANRTLEKRINSFRG